MVFILLVNGQSYIEKYRLQTHFSVPSGWANDPNGLIYSDGFYHLFYQHHPNSTKAGPISWGHAKSIDLIHWENLPIAIRAYEKGYIFSGCCVLDEKNLSGVNPPSSDVVPILAIFTLHQSETSCQSQGMAYSLDNGLTFTQYTDNPIIPNEGRPDWRDPNIFWRNGTFVMILAAGDRLQFYGSQNLLKWTYLSDFGVDPNEGDKNGVWECPSLITLNDEQGEEHDIILMSINSATRRGGFLYFIGKWNGTAFNSYNKTRQLRADSGYDNYASIPYLNDPLHRIILIGWMSDWLYGQLIPTSTWRGQMTLPRTPTLKTINKQLFIMQRPIDTFYTLIDQSRVWSLKMPLEISGEQIVDFTPQIPFKTGSMLTMNYTLNVKNAADGKFGFKFGNNNGEFVSFYYYIADGIYELDRSKSGDISFSPRFADKTIRAERIDTSNSLTGRIILDTASIEIFADDGLNTFTALFFPTDLYENIQLHVSLEDADLTKSVVVQELSVAALNGIWTKSTID